MNPSDHQNSGAGVFTPRTLEIESLLTGDYLSKEPQKVAKAAEQSGRQMFVALAAAEVASRLAAVESWRGEVIAELIAQPGLLCDGFTLLRPDFRDQALAGKVAFAEIGERAAAAFQDSKDRARDGRQAAKSQLYDLLAGMHADPERARQKAFPGAGLLLESGGFTLHRSVGEAKSFGRKSGGAFAVMPFARNLARVYAAGVATAEDADLV